MNSNISPTYISSTPKVSNSDPDYFDPQSANKTRPDFKCLACGHGGGYCRRDDDAGKHWCYKSLAVPGAKRTVSTESGLFSFMDDSAPDWAAIESARKERRENRARLALSIANPEQRDKIYRALLDRLELSENHRHDLHTRRKGRGLDLLKSYPGGRMTWQGPDPVGIPGFYKYQGKWVFTARQGILIPVIQNGLIVALQSQLEPGKKATKKRPKYIWVSTGGKDKKTGRPRFYDGTAIVGTPHGEIGDPTQAGRVWFTEGFYKAQAIHDKYGDPVVWIAGVDAQATIAARVDDFNAEQAVLAFDIETQNPDTIENVKNAETRLVKKLGQFEVLKANWAAAHKGADDAIDAGSPFKIAPLAERKLYTARAARSKLANFHAEAVKQGGPQTLKITTGGGKSNALDAYAKTKEGLKGRLVIALKTKGDMEETFLRMEEKGITGAKRRYGRTEDPHSPATCVNYQATLDAARNGHNVATAVCARCPFEAECKTSGYMAHVRNTSRSGILLTTHATVLSSPGVLKNAGAVVFDESPEPYERREFTRADLDTLERALAFSQTHPTDQRWHQVKALKELMRAPGEFLTTVQADFITEDLADAGLPFETPDGKVYYPQDIFRAALDGAALQLRPDGTLESVIHNAKAAEALEGVHSVIVMDATPHPEELAGLIGQMTIEEINIKQNIKVYQLAGRKHSQRQLRDESTGHLLDILAAIRKLGQTTKKVLVLANKGIREALERMGLPSTVTIGHIGKDNRATNAYEDYDVLIVTNPHIIPPAEAETRARLAGIEDPKVITENHKNAEMAQSIGRLRGVNAPKSKPKQVFVLTNAPYTCFEPDAWIHDIGYLISHGYKWETPQREDLLKRQDYNREKKALKKALEKSNTSSVEMMENYYKQPLILIDPKPALSETLDTRFTPLNNPPSKEYRALVDLGGKTARLVLMGLGFGDIQSAAQSKTKKAQKAVFNTWDLTVAQAHHETGLTKREIRRYRAALERQLKTWRTLELKRADFSLTQGQDWLFEHYHWAKDQNMIPPGLEQDFALLFWEWGEYFLKGEAGRHPRARALEDGYWRALMAPEIQARLAGYLNTLNALEAAA